MTAVTATRALLTVTLPLALLMLMAIVSSTRAAIVSYDFTGRILHGADNKPSIDAGDIFQGTFTYDTEAPLSAIGSGNGIQFFNYFPPGNGVTFTVMVGGYTVTHNPAFGPTIAGPPVFVVGNGGAVPGDFFRVGQNGVNSNTIAGATISSFSFQLGDPTGTVYNSGVPPQSLSLSDFTLSTIGGISVASAIQFNFNGGALGQTLVAEVLTLTPTAPVPIPVPAALPLFATALADAGFIEWRRRRSGKPGRSVRR